MPGSPGYALASVRDASAATPRTARRCGGLVSCLRERRRPGPPAPRPPPAARAATPRASAECLASSPSASARRREGRERPAPAHPIGVRTARAAATISRISAPGGTRTGRRTSRSARRSARACAAGPCSCGRAQSAGCPRRSRASKPARACSSDGCACSDSGPSAARTLSRNGSCACRPSAASRSSAIHSARSPTPSVIDRVEIARRGAGVRAQPQLGLRPSGRRRFRAGRRSPSWTPRRSRAGCCRCAQTCVPRTVPLMSTYNRCGLPT